MQKYQDDNDAEKGNAGDGALAEVIVPDPCMWTHEMPHLYRADVEARRGDAIKMARAELARRTDGLEAKILAEAADRAAKGQP